MIQLLRDDVMKLVQVIIEQVKMGRCVSFAPSDTAILEVALQESSACIVQDVGGSEALLDEVGDMVLADAVGICDRKISAWDAPHVRAEQEGTNGK